MTDQVPCGEGLQGPAWAQALTRGPACPSLQVFGVLESPELSRASSAAFRPVIRGDGELEMGRPSEWPCCRSLPSRPAGMTPQVELQVG